MSADTAWDREYRAAGIPSSSRDEPSGSLVWALSGHRLLRGAPAGMRALDVGCGTGRNTAHLASQGWQVTAFDRSVAAVDRARDRLAPWGRATDVRTHDLTAGLPIDDGAVDLVVDTFVYFHQTSERDREAYRAELRRVAAPGALWLVTVALDDDGYYGSCPAVPEAPSTVPVVRDPAAGIDNVLFTEAALRAETADIADLGMAWHKRSQGRMHGRLLHRSTLALLLEVRS